MRERAALGAPLWVRAAAAVIPHLPAGRYRLAHWLGRRAPEPFWTRLPADVGGLEFLCDLHDPLMREACFTGRYEPQETAVLRRLVRPGMTVVDVGANWGYFTLVAAHLVGNSGRVVSVEADPSAVRALGANVQRNALANVQLFGCAASDRAAELVFEPYAGGPRGSGNFGVAQAAGAASAAAVRVAAQPLDDLLDAAAVDRVDLLKMDIEGGEAGALRGLSRRLVSARVDRIVLELHPAALQALGSSMRAVIDSLLACGYDGWCIDHSPAAHRGTATDTRDVESLLSPLNPGAPLGLWPHVLWRRTGLAC